MCCLRNIALESVIEKCDRERTKWSLCVAMLRRRHKILRKQHKHTHSYYKKFEISSIVSLYLVLYIHFFFVQLVSVQCWSVTFWSGNVVVLVLIFNSFKQHCILVIHSASILFNLYIQFYSHFLCLICVYMRECVYHVWILICIIHF